MSAPTAPDEKPASGKRPAGGRRPAARARSRQPAPDAAREQRMSELGLAFRRVFRTLNRLRGRDTHLAGSELSHAQFQLLIELHERGELPTGELAAAAGLAAGTVTQMLDALVADAATSSATARGTDRRIVVTRLTPLGRRAIEAKRAAWQARWEAALEGVGEPELRAAASVLERLAAHARAGSRRGLRDRRAGARGRPAAGQEHAVEVRIPLL